MYPLYVVLCVIREYEPVCVYTYIDAPLTICNVANIYTYVQCTYGVCTSICQTVRASQFEGIVSDHIA